jgi:hypothetical protein
MPFPQPREAAVSHEDTSLGHTPEPALLAPPPTGEARLRRKGRAKHSCPRACPPRSHHYSLFTLQSAPPHFDRGGCRQSSPSPVLPAPAHAAPDAGLPVALLGAALLSLSNRQSFALPVLSAWLTQRPSPDRNCVATVVEVNGFEPMTSCLQSRRSPAELHPRPEIRDQRSADRACPGESQAIRPFAIPDD